MRDDELDDILKRQAAGAPLDPAVLNRVRASLLPSLQPVRPLAPAWVWIGVLLAIFGAIAAAGGAMLGMYGVRALDNSQRLVIFALLAVTGMAAATAIAREMAPAGTRAVHPAVMAAAGIIAFVAAFAALFHDYSMVQFGRGVSCLAVGLIFAAPAAVLVWLILRRGLALDRVAAGAAAGMLAGLAGLGVLELHCPILTAPHLLVWHLTVVVLSAAAGAVAGWLAGR